MNQESQIQKRSFIIKLLFFCLLILGLVVIWVKFFIYPPGWDFRNNLYLPAYLLLQHQSPYNIHVLVDGSNAVWFPMVIGIFFPLGYLDLQQASNLWWLLNLGALFGLIFISTEQRQPSMLKLILISLLVFLLPSSIAHFNLGQISILICLASVIIIRFEDLLPAWATGFLLALTLTKPQLVVFFIPSIYFFILRSRGWKRALVTGIWTLLGMMLFSLPVMLSSQNWLDDFMLNLMANPTWKHPSIYTIFFSSLGKIGEILGFIFFFMGFSLSLYLVTRLKKREAFLWILALTTVFSPYIWSWDFILLYPLMIYTLFRQKSTLTTTLLLSSYFLVLGGFATQKMIGQIDNSLTVWVPWCLLAITLIAQWLPEKWKMSEKSNFT